MLAEVYIENDEMRIVNFPKGIFKGKHWKINIEPIEEIKDDEKSDAFNQFVGILDNDVAVNDSRYNKILK